jgi:hypothetical protein
MVVTIPFLLLWARPQPCGMSQEIQPMSYRPIQQEAEPQVVDLPAPLGAAPSMRVTKEQLAAAERTREYHVRKQFQNQVTAGEGAAETSER